MALKCRYSAALLAVLVALALLCGGCTLLTGLGAEGRAELETELDKQLGLLVDKVTDIERSRAMILLERLWPLRQERLAKGHYEKSNGEISLIERLNQLYERYTIKYMGNNSVWGYGDPVQRTLGEYLIVEGEITPDASFHLKNEPGHDLADDMALWQEMISLLPEGAFADFSRFLVFTDGVDEVLAYVTMADGDGRKWEIAVDPADAKDGDWFRETVLHEYSHYLTLNSKQAEYSGDQTVDTYNEDGMQTYSDAYLNAFYQAFWTATLEDRLINTSSTNFFLRHEDEFVTEYASTDPSEDIAESFTYFVVYDRQEGDEVWAEKLNFFYNYPELVNFRTRVRVRMGKE